LPGGAVALVDREGTRLVRTFGAASRDELFELGSISKVTTALVVHRLIEDGAFSLDTAITEILPWLDLGDGAAITIRRLLQHSGGIITGADAVQDQSAQAWSLRDRRRATAPGEFFHYSNLGFILLGLAASRATGRPLPELVHELVLEPLEMRGSLARLTNDDRQKLAPGTAPRDDDRPWLPGDAMQQAPWLEVDGADGNVAAPIDDLARLVGGLLRRGAGVLRPESFDRMITDVGPGGEDVLALEGVPHSETSAYGLGVNVERVGGRVVLSHGGGMVGYASFALADLGTGRGVAVLTNANGDSPIAEAIARTAGALWDGSATVPCFDPSRWRTAGRLDDRPRRVPPGLVGDFRATDAAGATVAVSVREVRDDAETASCRLVISCEGLAAPLLWSWGGRIATSHPRFRRVAFEFDPDSGRLAWGGLVFRPGTAPARAVTAHPEYLGTYRSFSPWFPRFRVVDREGQLVLIAPMGVEAFGEDTPLVEIGPGVYRCGADPRLPETLEFGPVVDGRAIWADRDGCRHSRSFTD